MAGVVCYCKLGMMAQCVAKDVFEQQACHFSRQSSVSKKCMHLNVDMNNHCWNIKAHNFSTVHGVVRLEDITTDEPETIYDESEELGLSAGVSRTCKTCLLYTSCVDLIDLARATPGGITDQNLWTKGSSCGSFLEEIKTDLSGGI